MTIDEFIGMMTHRAPPAAAEAIAQLERSLGATLPDDYAAFLRRGNGGFIGGALWYKGPTPAGEAADAGVHHVGGLRPEPHFSLAWNRDCYANRIPRALLWIMDDPFGNAICLGLEGDHRGRIYFWDHEGEPDPDEWDGTVEKAGNIRLLADAFTGFVAGLTKTTGIVAERSTDAGVPRGSDAASASAIRRPWWRFW